MHAEDERSIRAALTAHTELWVHHEMWQWGMYFTENSDFITHRRIWWRSREASIRGHLGVPESVIVQKREYAQEIMTIDELAPGVALVHTRWSWPGHVLPGTETAEDRQGFLTLVLLRHDGEWRIQAAHNTRTNGLDDFPPGKTVVEARRPAVRHHRTMRTGARRPEGPAGPRPDTTGRLPPDFYRLWSAFTVGQLGSAVGAGALPLAAILLVGASDLQVSLMAAGAGVAAAAIALPLGPFLEFRRKRPVMTGAGITACAALISVPIAARFGVLTYAHLCVTAAIQTLCAVVFNAARDAHLKTLVPQGRRIRAGSRLETTFWTSTTLGGPVGGLLVTVFGSTTTLLVDSLGHLVSALGIRRIRTPENPPAQRGGNRPTAAGIRAGWTYLFAHPALHRLFWNAMLFGGSLVLISPLLALLMLRELGFPPWQYGLALGMPGLGGLLGSWCAPRLVARFGEHTVLLGSGTLRTCWPGLLVLAGPGPLGLAVVLVAETLLLFCSGVFNPVFAAYRTNHTADDHMVRVGTAWSISARCVQPAFIALGGVLATAIGVRAAIGVAALALPVSAALLPWGVARRDAEPTPATTGGRRDNVAP